MTREEIIQLLELCETAEGDARMRIVENPSGSMTSEEARMILKIQGMVQQSFERGNRPNRIKLSQEINDFLQRGNHKRGESLRVEINMIVSTVLFFESNLWRCTLQYTLTRPASA